jgi:predicted SnoaL-like aldol condensation-catalyzing enzyme
MSGEDEALVTRYYAALYSARADDAVATWLAPDYIEHQYTAQFSKEGLLRYVTDRLHAHSEHWVIIHKVLRDGDFVFLLVEEQLGGGVVVARGELFRLAQGKIAEHWGAHVIDEPNRKNINGSFDGPLPDRTVDYARRHAARFEALDLRGFDGQELDCFSQSRTLDYRQHSPKGGDGLDGLVSILRSLKEAGTQMMMQPKRVLTDGDFILCHRLYNTDPPHPLINRINTFDLFRINRDGKAVEHWDVMEDVPSEDLLDRMF